ncbi:AAA family ATPase [Aliarcobacter skirrowii]|uniref:AAA family ATPase n=1 Tax=Aliarcobacter skirrowii TaxID=28200 RepID=UPI0029B7476D|nr:AAA family ATPase [Aliarcobacter skirrowii]MDX4060218.1 AAA family ATPase [Aliarcobacter skirrowii]
MGIKIKKISVKNFKLFTNLETMDLDNPSLIVLDGPNGFGKTSFYDSLEILFTGKLRRYSSLSNIIDGRQQINDNPILCNKALLEDEMVIKVELEINGTTYYLMRKEGCETLANSIDFKTFSLPLYQLSDYEANTGDLVDNSETFFNSLLGNDFNKNFGFLNYIEQEDNTYLLKQKDKDRKAYISHLFNTDEINNKIKQLSAVKDKLNGASNNNAKAEYEAILTRKNEYLSNLLTDIEESEYTQLFPEKEIFWDKEDLDFTSSNYSLWLGENGELNKLIFFINNFEDFENKTFNNELEKLTEDKTSVVNLLSFFNFLDENDDLKNKLIIHNQLEKYVKSFEKGILTVFQEEKIDVPKNIEDIIKLFIDIVEYKAQIIVIKSKIDTSNKLERILSNIKESRENLISKYKEYLDDSSDTVCPVCGYDWKEKKDLLDSFENQSTILSELITSNGGELESLIQDFDKKFIKPMIIEVNKFFKDNKLDESFINQLQEIKKTEENLKNLNSSFEKLGIELSTFFNQEPKTVIDLDEKIIKLKENIKEVKKDFEPENIKEYFSDYFVRYFDEKKEKLEILKTEQLIQKKKYINWKYSSYQNTEILRLDNEYNTKKEKYDKASQINKKLSKIIKIYNDELKLYHEKLIKDIEILFHIYSGRIMQDNQNSLGLFIKADKIGIRFIESVKVNSSGVADYDKYDAIFSMSSGQLASLIISFTLALNKRYSKSKLLFIDDPVQTLDELNIAGFINLLRNEFSDRQIFMSTHEQMMSAYMRYKFQKFGLETMQINFKDKYTN